MRIIPSEEERVVDTASGAAEVEADVLVVGPLCGARVFDEVGARVAAELKAAVVGPRVAGHGDVARPAGPVAVAQPAGVRELAEIGGEGGRDGVDVARERSYRQQEHYANRRDVDSGSTRRKIVSRCARRRRGVNVNTAFEDE